jgi:hypothetical protein
VPAKENLTPHVETLDTLFWLLAAGRGSNAKGEIVVSSSVQSLKIKAKLLQKAKRRRGQPVQLKETLRILASAAGYTSWKTLKDSLELGDLFCPPAKAATHAKNWHRDYASARALLHERRDLFLLPYGKQFFVCDRHWIEQLGVSSNDLDVTDVGQDWAVPRNSAAWRRLLSKLRARRAIAAQERLA